MKNEEVELINFKNVLKSVEVLESPSRADIAKYLGISRTTSSQNINKLIDLQLVKESENNLIGRGRPGISLIVDKDRWLALGVCFEDNMLFFSVVNLAGEIKEKKRVDLNSINFNTFFQELCSNLRYFLNKYEKDLLPAIGIGSPGVIEPKSGSIIKAVDLGWYNIPLKKMLEDEFKLPVYINNRYRTMGLAEARQGLGKNYDNFIYLGVGNGFGTAIFLEGKLVLTTNIHTGGIGHIVVDPDGPYCRCGKKGCLFTVASLSVFEENTIKLLEEKHKKSILDNCKKVDMKTIMDAANKGDELARKSVIKVANPLCTVIGDLINIINPQRIIIGGPMGIYGDFYCDYISKKIANYYNTTEISIVQTQTDFFGGAVGAAYQVLDNKLELVLNKIE